jgi:hypothetical protein
MDRFEKPATKLNVGRAGIKSENLTQRIKNLSNTNSFLVSEQRWKRQEETPKLNNSELEIPEQSHALRFRPPPARESPAKSTIDLVVND